MQPRALLWICLALLGACGDDPSVVDGGRSDGDPGRLDGGGVDAGTAPDSGQPVDAGRTSDSGPVDAGAVDAGSFDGGGEPTTIVRPQPAARLPHGLQLCVTSTGIEQSKQQLPIDVSRLSGIEREEMFAKDLKEQIVERAADTTVRRSRCHGADIIDSTT